MVRDETVVHRGMLSSPGEVVLFWGIGALVTLVGWVWLTGQFAALTASGVWPAGSLIDSIEVIFQLPGTWEEPARAWPPSVAQLLPGAVALYAWSAVTGTALGATYWVIGRRIFTGGGQRGFASATQLREGLSPTAALARSKRLRPHLEADPRARDVSLDLGRSTRTRVALAAPIDSSIVVMAPPRAGKTSQLIIPWLASWTGPAVVTSVRNDVALNTYKLRQEIGPVAVLDLTDTAWPDTVSWCPTNRCHQFDVARTRADLIVTVGKSGESDSTNAGFFGTTATYLLAGWLHAAALSRRSMSDVLEWALDESNMDSVTLLAEHPQAEPGIAALMEGIYRSPIETRSSIFATVMTGLASLVSAKAKRVFSPRAGEGLDIDEFLKTSGTIYIQVSEQEARQLAPLITSFVDDILTTAKRIGDADPTGRIDPPLGMILDEIANISPLPHAPELMSYAAGSGICMVAVLQHMAGARNRWGDVGADALWSGATTKIALGGLGGADAKNFSDLAGEYRERITTPQHSRHGVSVGTTLTDRNALSPGEVRKLSLARREALVIHADIPPVITRLTRHYQSRDRKRYANSVDVMQKQLNNDGRSPAEEKLPW